MYYSCITLSITLNVFEKSTKFLITYQNKHSLHLITLKVNHQTLTFTGPYIDMLILRYVLKA